MKAIEVSFLTALLSAGACAQSDGLDEVAESAEAEADVASAESALLGDALDGADDEEGPTAEGIAERASARFVARAEPPGCATRTRDGAVVTYVLDDCASPRGPRHVSGTVVVTYSLDDAGVHAQTAASGLQIGRVTDVTLDATATRSRLPEGGRQLSVHTNSAGVGPLGHAVSHRGDYTVIGDGECRTLDGAWSSERGTRSRSTTISGLVRCGDGCPEAGTVTRTRGDGRSVTVTFDGSAEASWVSGERSGTFELACGSPE